MDVEQMRTARKRAVDRKRRQLTALARARGEQTGFIDAAPIRAHVKALVALGWSTEALIHATQCTGTSAGLLLLTNGTSRKAERKWLPILDFPLTLNVPESVPETCFVPTLGATRRVRALMALGWRHEDITELVGRASHHLSAGRHPRMTALDWRVVDAAYEQMSASHGESVRTRKRAEASGFAPPLAWDDIDDPSEQPQGVRTPMRRDLLAEWHDLQAAGESIEQAAVRLGVTVGAIERAEYRKKAAA